MGANKADIAVIEDALGGALPLDYVKCMLLQDGGAVDFSCKYYHDLPEEYPDPPLVMGSVFPISELRLEYDRVRSDFGYDILPIAVDNFGNYICLDFKATISGGVYFMDHELTDESGCPLVVKIADSYETFVCGLSAELD